MLYSLGIEVIQQNDEILSFQKKYISYILKKLKIMTTFQ